MGMLVFLEGIYTLQAAQDMEIIPDILENCSSLDDSAPERLSTRNHNVTTSNGSSWLYNPLDPKNRWKNEGLLHRQNMG